MKDQLRAICLLLFSLLLFGFYRDGLWLPILGSAVEELSGYAAFLCGIGGIYLAFRKGE